MGCCLTTINIPIGQDYEGIKGKGLLQNEEGDVYDGEWVGNQVLQGQGILSKFNQYNYEGQFYQGKMHGSGIIQRIDGERYEGGFMNNKYHGKGRETLPTGEVFQVQYFEGARIGRQRVHSSLFDGVLDMNVKISSEINSETYQRYRSLYQNFSEHALHNYVYFGEIISARHQGQGKLMDINGTYLGGFLEDLRHGYGVQATSQGTFKGQFRLGQESGNGLKTGIFGLKLGQFQSGRIVGETTSIKDGVIEVIHLVDQENQIFLNTLINRHFGISKQYFKESQPIGSEIIKSDTMKHVGCKKQSFGTLIYKQTLILFVKQLNENAEFCYIIQNKTKFQGCIVNSVKQNQGVIQTENQIYNGNWLNSLYHGNGTCYYQDGSLYIGEWSVGRRNGLGVLITINGVQQEGQWRDDKLESYSETQ